MAADPFNPAPPTEPFDDLPPEPVKWPKVVGTISIIWGCFGLLCNTCGALKPLLDQWAAGMAPPEQRAEIERQRAQMQAFEQWPIETVLMVTNVGLAIFLLVSGIMLVARKPLAGQLHIAYALWAFLSIAAGLVIGLMKIPAMMQAVKDHPDLPMSGFMKPPVIIGMTVVVLALRLAWPTFCLIWFGLKKKHLRELAVTQDESAA